MLGSDPKRPPWPEAAATNKLGYEGAIAGAATPLGTILGAGIALPNTNRDYTMRIVKVFIADSNVNIPLDKRVLYSGTEKLTDLTDQELFFEVSIGELLSAHNSYRSSVLDRAASDKFGRNIYLEPVRIRDLKMVVVDVATFG